MDKVSVLLTDNSWLEGTFARLEDYGIWLKDVYRSYTGVSGSAPVGESVVVPWANILFFIAKE